MCACASQELHSNADSIHTTADSFTRYVLLVTVLTHCIYEILTTINHNNLSYNL
jgi:hypothetical protein